jgi:hypothetical protein
MCNGEQTDLNGFSLESKGTPNFKVMDILLLCDKTRTGNTWLRFTENTISIKLDIFPSINASSLNSVFCEA